LSGVGSRIIATGAISAALAVAAGAFGAHGLEGRVSSAMLAVWETGARYHFYHSLGMIVVGLLALHHAAPPGTEVVSARHEVVSRRLRWAAVLMLTGIVLFSGTLYTMTLSGLLWLGAITPLGGVSFLAAWALFAWAALDV
jgi:uncharacterized membrane protein YgdD (TMEM256/DUF423 family)